MLMEFFESIWEIMWWFFGAFVFVATIFTLIMVFTDLFRDRDLNGWAKAVWVLFLVFIPLLTSLVYLTVRHKGVKERAVSEFERQKEAQEQYIRDVAQVSVADEIAKAKGLLDSGAITQQEFEQLKGRTLQGTS